MPIYEYQCQKCGFQFEKLQRLSDPPPNKCPECGGKLAQLLSAPAVRSRVPGGMSPITPARPPQELMVLSLPKPRRKRRPTPANPNRPKPKPANPNPSLSGPGNKSSPGCLPAGERRPAAAAIMGHQPSR
ncbi:MAG: FmdB family zinc ribbon protein [Deltaproteobacteria bacterium]